MTTNDRLRSARRRALGLASLFAATLAPASAVSQIRAETRIAMTVAGRPYVVLSRPANVRQFQMGGEEWLQLTCWAGDRPAWDVPAVDRIGLDGWVKPFRWGSTVDLSFRFVLRENVLPERGGWVNLFETHEKNWPGVGFIRLVGEWDGRLKRPVLRLRAGNATLWTDERPSLYSIYSLRLRFTAGGPGGIQMWSYGRQVVDWRGYVGHSALTPLYPQFRIYRNTQRRVATMYLKVDGGSED